MKAIRIKMESVPLKTDVLYSHLKYNGFKISNPDCTRGEYLDIIVRGNQKIAGMDLLIKEGDFPVFNSNELYLATDWIEDHGNR